MILKVNVCALAPALLMPWSKNPWQILPNKSVWPKITGHHEKRKKIAQNCICCVTDCHRLFLFYQLIEARKNVH